MTSRDVALSYAARRLRSSQTLAQNVGPRLTRDDLLFFSSTPPGAPATPVVTEDSAMGNAFFGRAVELICNAAASTEWFARRFSAAEGLKLPLADQPSIVTEPSPLQTLWQYRWATTEDGILYGNHFALLGDIDWRTNRPGWLVPLPADQVWIMTDPASPGWYQWVIGGETFDIDEIFHVAYGQRSGEILGRGKLAQYHDSLSGVLAADEYSRDTFSLGALPPAVITVNGPPTQTVLDDLKAKWRDIVSTREPVVLPNGTQVTPIVSNASQAQLVEARKWNATLTANVVGVPGWKLGLEGPTMTYQNVETGDIEFVRDSVDRYVRPLTASITRWLLPSGTELVPDYDSRMRVDQKTSAEILTQLVAAEIITVDEARAKLNRAPLGDETPTPLPASEPIAASVIDDSATPIGAF